MIAPSTVYVHAVTIPDNGWTDYSEVFNAAPESYLTATLLITSALMHLEAVRVYLDPSGVHLAVDPACRSVVNRIYVASESDGSALETLDIYGREYLVMATPHLGEPTRKVGC